MTMLINANTKIAPLLKHHAGALEAIISVSPKFEKLRNPLLRKVMAGRTTLAMASKFGGCTLDDLFQKLEPLGFEIDRQTKLVTEEKKPVPQFVTTVKKEQLTELDVRPVIAAGEDPLHIIMEKIKALKPQQVLRLINSFEPIPLVLLLEKKGYHSYADVISTDHVETYFYKATNEAYIEEAQPVTNDWEKMLQRFKGKMEQTDVRHLQMPTPMLTILDRLDNLPPDTALYVYHKRIPVFLLPELAEKGFEYRIEETDNGEVHLLIFKN